MSAEFGLGLAALLSDLADLGTGHVPIMHRALSCATTFYAIRIDSHLGKCIMHKYKRSYPMTPTPQSVRPALHAVLGILSVLIEMAVDPRSCDAVAAESDRLGQVINHAQIILDLLKMNQRGTLQ